MSRFKDRLRVAAAIKDLQPARTVVSVFCEPSSGPRWTNSPVYVVWRDREGGLHEDCILPEDQTMGMKLLYDIASAVHGSLVNEVIRFKKEYSR